MFCHSKRSVVLFCQSLPFFCHSERSDESPPLYHRLGRRSIIPLRSILDDNPLLFFVIIQSKAKYLFIVIQSAAHFLFLSFRAQR